MSVEVRVAGVDLNKETQTPSVVLVDAAGDVVLIMDVGLVEASIIAAKLERVRFPRPLTHDLMAMVLLALKGRLEKAEIHSIENDIYHGRLIVKHGKRHLEIDCRPSDGIALALGLSRPIFVADEVALWYRQSRSQGTTGAESSETADGLSLEDLEDDDFPKYKM